MAYSEAFIDTHRNINVDYEWWDSVYDDFHTICGILGIELDEHEPSFSGFWCQGDGASWRGTYSGVRVKFADGHMARVYTYEEACTKIREHAPKDETLHKIADTLCYLNRTYGAVVAHVYRPSAHYVHSNTMCIDEWSYYFDADHADEVDPDLAALIEETLITQFRALADWLYATLEKEHEYLTSDEAVVETLDANEIEEELDEDDVMQAA